MPSLCMKKMHIVDIIIYNPYNIQIGCIKCSKVPSVAPCFPRSWWCFLSLPPPMGIVTFRRLRSRCILGSKKISRRSHCYCRWKKSCTTWSVLYPFIKVSYVPGGAGFLPSTVFLFMAFTLSPWLVGDSTWCMKNFITNWSMIESFDTSFFHHFFFQKKWMQRAPSSPLLWEPQFFSQNFGEFWLWACIRSVQFRFMAFIKMSPCLGRGNRCHCESFHLGNLHGDRDCSVPQNDRVFVSLLGSFKKRPPK